ncbi:MAG: chemotaxis response regulator protein-glutamate methylesterase [Methanosarcinales archaeon]|nr:chemotaxis response regulator protein-glutamate methylesterase [Methanosarcinales archaeon]
MAIRALVVDDSAFMRKVISDILNQDPNINVIATARNGQDAVEKVERLKPDVVTLDNEMPVLSGLNALGYIMSECPTPVVMLSSVDEKAADITLTAFEYGAVDFIQKPSGSISLDIGEMADHIRAQVKIAASVDLRKLGFMEEHVKKTVKPKAVKKVDVASTKTTKKAVSANGTAPTPVYTRKILAIASSTGGPRALEQVIPKLPRNLNAAVLVVQHMPAGFTASLSQRLDSQSELRVKEAQDGDIVQEGVVLLAPGNYHMEIVQKEVNGIMKEVVALNQRPREQGVRPCANILFQSIAPIYGSNILSVVLTGMGVDGADGVAEIKSRGGRAISEDQSSCVVYGMPKAIADRGLADSVVPLDMVSNEIVRMLKS